MRKRQTEQDEGSFRFRENIKFSAWADEWLAAFKGKESTRRVYGTTLDYAKRAFGSKSVRDLHTADVRRFLDLIERETAERSKVSPIGDKKQATPGRSRSTYGNSELACRRRSLRATPLRTRFAGAQDVAAEGAEVAAVLLHQRRTGAALARAR